MKKQMLDTITRRDFIKAVGGTVLATAFGCTTIETPKPRQITASQVNIKPEMVRYPNLPGKKIQPPENGCLVGFRKVYVPESDPVFIGRQVEIAKKARNIDEYVQLAAKENILGSYDLGGMIKRDMKNYDQAFGVKPAVHTIMDTSRLYLDFPTREAEAVANNGVIPYINAAPGSVFLQNLRFSLEEIASEKRDSYLTKFAKGAAEFGKKHGAFFMTTMEESNGDWYYWGQSSKFVPAWRHILQIFEDQGANQYATWVWEAYCPEAAGGRAKHPDIMYPGDKYVDWIGLSAFARQKYPTTDVTLGALVGQTYNQMRKNHPDKPIMQAEFGKSQDWGQPRWLVDAFKTIKQMPGMKAAVYWDNVTVQLNDDKTLSIKSLETLKEIVKDPYWIMAK